MTSSSDQHIHVKPDQGRSFGPVGQCIYCAATDVELSDEHIVPKALDGRVVLKKASCGPCRDLTSAIELRVLRGFMREYRAAAGLPTRRKAGRPTSIPLSLLGHDGTVTNIEGPPGQIPGMMLLPGFAPCSYLAKTPPARGIPVQVPSLVVAGQDPRSVVRKAGAKGISFSQTPDIEGFAQLLAKIAHGVLVCTIGMFDISESPLIPYLHDPQDGGRWIGGCDFALGTETHRTAQVFGVKEILDNDGATVGHSIQMKLFANRGGRGYEVVARLPGWHNYAS